MGTKRGIIRAKIDRKFRSDSDLSAFCLDNFPAIAAKFTSGMNRTDKVNLLLEQMTMSRLLRALNEYNQIGSSCFTKSSYTAPNNYWHYAFWGCLTIVISCAFISKILLKSQNSSMKMILKKEILLLIENSARDQQDSLLQNSLRQAMQETYDLVVEYQDQAVADPEKLARRAAQLGARALFISSKELDPITQQWYARLTIIDKYSGKTVATLRYLTSDLLPNNSMILPKLKSDVNAAIVRLKQTEREESSAGSTKTSTLTEKTASQVANFDSTSTGTKQLTKNTLPNEQQYVEDVDEQDTIKLEPCKPGLMKDLNLDAGQRYFIGYLKPNEGGSWQMDVELRNEKTKELERIVSTASYPNGIFVVPDMQIGYYQINLSSQNSNTQYIFNFFFRHYYHCMESRISTRSPR